MGNLLIFGAGQYGMVAKEIAESMNCFAKIDFLDDNSTIAVGKIGEYARFTPEYDYAIVAIGNSELRLSLTEKLRNEGYKIATLISPRAYISPSAKIHDGCIVEAMAVVNTESEILDCCFISAGTIINHNSLIESGCHIDCNATVQSNSVIKAQTKIDYGQVIKNG